MLEPRVLKTTKDSPGGCGRIGTNAATSGVAHLHCQSSRGRSVHHHHPSRMLRPIHPLLMAALFAAHSLVGAQDRVAVGCQAVKLVLDERVTPGERDRLWATDESVETAVPAVLELQGCHGERLDSRCLLYTSPSPRDGLLSRMPSSA